MRLNWGDSLDDIWLFNVKVHTLSAPTTWFIKLPQGHEVHDDMPLPCLCVLKFLRHFKIRMQRSLSTGFMDQKEQRNAFKRVTLNCLFLFVYRVFRSNVTLTDMAAVSKDKLQLFLRNKCIRLDVALTITTVHYHTHVIWDNKLLLPFHFLHSSSYE